MAITRRKPRRKTSVYEVAKKVGVAPRKRVMGMGVKTKGKRSGRLPGKG